MKILQYLLTILVFVAAFVFIRHNPAAHDSREADDTRLETSALPESDWFIAERMFPRMALPQNVSQKMTRSVDAFRKNNSGKSAMASGAWKFAGPSNVGGRITSVLIHPTNPDIVYAAAASGGVWKSTDFCGTWTNVFNGSFSVGALAFDPENPSVVYVGTGEANPSSVDTYPGNGIWRSTDDGATWTNLGLGETGHIGKIVVNPLNPNTIYVAALGLYRSKNVDKGVYKSIDAGTSWTRVLFVDSISGATDIEISPADTNRILAAGFTYYRTLPAVSRSGTGSGIYLSTNAGVSWALQTIGIVNNNPDLGRISLDFSKSNPSTVYAVTSNGGGYNFDGVYKSTDGGEQWLKVFTNPGFGESQVWYNCILRIHPTNPNLIWLGMTGLYKSIDGTNFASASFTGSAHSDYHAIEYAPSNPSRIVIGNDGGIYTSTDGGSTFAKSPNLPITQFYAGTVSGQNPGYLLGGTQDNGSVRSHNSIANSWSFFHGGDGFYCLIDPTDSNYVYAEYQNGGLEYSIDGGSSFNNGLTGINPSEPVNWSQPIAMDPQHPKTLYTGTNFLYKTTNNMQSWTKISPQLTYGYPGFYSTMSTIDVASTDSNVVYAGTGDGRLWVTTNGGGSWSDIAPGLPLRWISRITVDPYIANIAYVTLSGFREYDSQGHLYRTTNYGSTWTDIGTTLPDVPLNDVVVDPLFPNTLYIASDINVMMTANLGASWSVLGTGLPDVTVHDLAFHSASRTLAAFTHGRSIYTYTVSSATSSVSVDLTPGWNLISDPVQSADVLLATLFPGTLTRAYRYEGGAYHAKDSLLPGIGYWVKYPPGVSTPRVIEGASMSSTTVAVVAGWNLVGSISLPVPVANISSAPPALITSQFFLYDGHYSPASTVDPGHGYWVKVSGAGTLTLSSVQIPPADTRIRIVPSDELPPGVPEPEGGGAVVPVSYSISQNYPNPFNPTTRINYTIAEKSNVQIDVYNMLGEDVATLVNGVENAGEHFTLWNAGSMPSGVYSYRIVAGAFVETRKMVVVK